MPIFDDKVPPTEPRLSREALPFELQDTPSRLVVPPRPPTQPKKKPFFEQVAFHEGGRPTKGHTEHNSHFLPFVSGRTPTKKR